MNESTVQKVIHYAEYCLSVVRWGITVLREFPRLENYKDQANIKGSRPKPEDQRVYGKSQERVTSSSEV